jgi:hypothetical protein
MNWPEATTSGLVFSEHLDEVAREVPIGPASPAPVPLTREGGGKMLNKRNYGGLEKLRLRITSVDGVHSSSEGTPTRVLR